MVTLGELEVRVTKIEKALRMLARTGNDNQTHATPKIMKLDPPEGADHIWMNTTYCFDTARRLEFMFQALHEIVHPGAVVDEALLAENLRNDYRGIHQPAKKTPPNWEAAARQAEQLLIQRYVETRDEYHFEAHMDEAIRG